MLSCASKNRTCMSSGGEEIDLKQHLIYMQMSIKEIGVNVNGLVRKVETTSLGISSVEQQLLQMKQQQIFAKMDKGPSFAELDNMVRRNIEQAVAERDHAVAANSHSQLAITNQHMDAIRSVEQGVNEILLSARTSAREQAKPPESKAGAPDHVTGNVLSQMREELGSFQAGLMHEFKKQQEAIVLELQHVSKMNALLQEVPQQAAVQLQHPASQSVPHWGSQFGAHFGGDSLEHKGASAMQPPMADLPIPEEEPTPRYDTDLGKQTPGTPPRTQAQAEPVTKAAVVAMDPIEAEEEALDHTTIQLKEGDSLASVFLNDEDVENPPYNVEDFYSETGLPQRIARSSTFANFTVLVVAVNAVYIGVDSDHNDAQNIYGADWPFQVFSQFFCVYFTFELVIRMLAFKKTKDCLKDGWFKFDAFLVSTMILDTWVLMPTLYIIGGKMKIPTQPLRMLRLFKLTRMARLMKAFPELVTMIKGLVRSLRAISSSMILIGLMVYVWAIMMHMLLKEEHEFNDRIWKESMISFSTIIKCIWTLLMDGTLLLDGANVLMTEMLFSSKFNFVCAGFCFFMYALLSALLILQMLIGVLCDVVSRVGAEQRDATAIGLVKQELLGSLQEFDGGDGKISQEELFQVMNSPKSKAVLHKLNINRAFLLELQKMMFTKPGQQVSIKACLQVMIMCRGDNITTVESMAGGLLSIISELNGLRYTLENDLKALSEGRAIVPEAGSMGL